ncbi:MAG TPA: Hpt domain-containing protein [Candidatus Sulfotelmatobacter sp.]|nr:Hpt domain-containing protein [Candidatus Sulfotelmatobacter sp.]
MPDGVLDEAILGNLLETVGGDRTFLAELVEAYLADSPALVQAMRTGLATDDRTVLRRAAHTLKSTSASMGAIAFAAMCREVETNALEAEPPWLGAHIQAVALAYEPVAAALRERVRGATS